MPCNWLLVEDTKLCKNPAKGQYCATHIFKIRKGIIILQPCKGYGREIKSSLQLCVPCSQGYKYARDLMHYLEDILPIDLDEYAQREDICRRCPITMLSIVERGMSLFTIERNGKMSLDNLIEMNYFSLSALLEMCWDNNKARKWKSVILVKFLHHPNLISSKY
ncbi:20119_t:CDS:2, partial [Racocetra persica]